MTTESGPAVMVRGTFAVEGARRSSVILGVGPAPHVRVAPSVVDGVFNIDIVSAGVTPERGHAADLLEAAAQLLRRGVARTPDDE